MFEEINNLDGDLQTYTPKYMLNWWFNNPNHRDGIYHPAVNKLAILLDKELLIGESSIVYWGGLPLSGIMNTEIYGTGDCYIEFNDEVGYWNVQM